MADSRKKDAYATPQRARAIFPKTNDTQTPALNYDVRRVGADDLMPWVDNNWTRPFVAGVIDVKTAVTKSADEGRLRIRECLEYVPGERLGLTTECGLIKLPRMITAGTLQRTRRRAPRSSARRFAARA